MRMKLVLLLLSSPARLVHQLVLQLPNLLLDEAHLLSVDEQRVLLEGQRSEVIKPAFDHRLFGVSLRDKTQTFRLRSIIVNAAHPRCPFGIHDSVPLSLDGAERLLIVRGAVHNKTQTILTHDNATLHPSRPSLGPTPRTLNPLDWV